jgi:hypothetical protein
MGIQAEAIESGHGKPQFEEKPLEFTLTKDDLARIKQVPASQLRDLGFADATDLLDSFSLKQTNTGNFLGKISPIKPIIPGGKGGDKHPGGDTPGNPGGDWLPDPDDILDLSDEAKEALKTALAIAVIVGVVGICISNPALMPAAARTLSVLGPALAPRAMQFAR